MFKPDSKTVYSFLILIFAVVGCAKKQPDYGMAPQFTLPDINGNQVSLSDFKGKVVILDFWTTWCGPCVKEVPHFIELYDKYKEQGFEMVGISLDQGGADDVKPFVEKMGVNYTMLIGSQDITKKYGGISSIPTTFVIDKAGKIQRKYVGYRDKTVFEKDIEALLVEQ
jgi:cytochrome c biogenesis protein CcmG/thiol:disulfide interchange protein DsbE